MATQNIVSNAGTAGLGPWSSPSMVSPPDFYNKNQYSFTVEKVDNGFVMRSANRPGEIAKVKIAKDADELKELFIQSLVEHRMEK